MCRNFRFDSTLVRGIRLPVRSGDPWSVLVRSYTGSKMLFNLLFLFVFFIPFVLKALLYVSLSHVEATLLAHAQHATGALAAGSGVASLATTELCARFRCIDLPVWRLILESGPGFLARLAAIGLLAYNLIRAFLTWRIAPLKEEEAASGQTPLYFPWAPGFFSTLFSANLPPGSSVPAGRGVRATMVRSRLRLKAAVGESVDQLPSYLGEIWHAYAPLSALHRIISIAFFATLALAGLHFLIFFQAKVAIPAGWFGDT